MPLSIIIPCLNEAEGIVDALSALAPLRARGVEVVVVDGGSVDATVALAQPLADQVITATRGRAMQMNAGVAQACGSILLFLHADCRLPGAADGLITDGLNRARKTWGRFDVELTGHNPLLHVVGALMNLRSRLTGISTGDQGLFVTRSLFEAVGKYPQIALMEDVALSKQLKRYGSPLNLRHRMVVSGRRWEKQGVLRTVLLMWRLRLQYWLGTDPENWLADMSPTSCDALTIVFAKAPRAGEVKTRLIPLLGAAGAAALHRQLIHRTLVTATGAGLGPVELHGAPDIDDTFLQDSARRFAIALAPQRGANLGARMAYAFDEGLARHARVILIGTDCPALTPQHLADAQAALARGDDAVLIPAEDGGYALIGLTRCDARLFAEIEWGSNSVLAATRERLKALGWRWHELETLWDIDRPEDYRRWSELVTIDGNASLA